MHYLELVLDAIERGHKWLSAKTLGGVSRAWAYFSARPLTLRFALGFVVASLIAFWCGYETDLHYVHQIGIAEDEALMRYLERAGHLAGGHRLGMTCLGVGVLCVFAAGAAFLKKSFAFRLMQAAWAAFAVTGTLAFFWMMKVGTILNSADHKAFESATRNDHWTGLFFWGLLAAVFALALLLSLVLKSTRAKYMLVSAPLVKDAGEKAFEGLKTTTGDRRWKSSIYYTLTIFFFVMFGGYLMFGWGWEDYGLPAGGGEQAVEQAVKVKKIKKKKQKKLTVNPWSPYILERMSIDDVKTMEELEEQTRDTYVADNGKRKGGKGKGTGGWPNGMEGAAIRFIRLKYRGGDWDQDMGKGADYNLLIKFHEWTGMKIAKETEFREIERLKYFPKKRSPPFVFLTGMGGINVSEKEVQILRKYCLEEGGMLFIDNGGGHFDGSVKALLRRVFPGKPLVDIPNDDVIYQRPYVFPDGAPPFWHHAGYRAMGIRDEGRWVVFYHPGDVNDAWRDDHSGASAEVADQAYKLGVNIMFYAFNQYYKRHYE